MINMYYNLYESKVIYADTKCFKPYFMYHELEHVSIDIFNSVVNIVNYY